MKNTMSIVAIALMMAGSTALAGSGCEGCSSKKGDKDKAEYKETPQQTACGGSHKKDDGKEKTA